jgi:hypothetical protein
MCAMAVSAAGCTLLVCDCSSDDKKVQLDVGPGDGPGRVEAGSIRDRSLAPSDSALRVDLFALDAEKPLRSDGATGDAVSGCGGVSPVGCCKGEVLYWCDGGVLRSSNCAAEPHCGWEPDFGNYDCATAGFPDPTAKYPMLCP